MDTCPSHPYVVLPQTVTTKLEAHNCLACLCMLLDYNFPSLELRGPNLFQHDNVPAHKVSSITCFAKVDVDELECSAQSPDLNPEHLLD